MASDHEISPPITHLIRAWSEGQAGASNALADEVYTELHRIASHQLRQQRPQGLEPTELVHEAWIKLGRGHGQFPSRGHFFAFAALQMRRLLIDLARAAQAARRDGEEVTLSLHLVDPSPQPTQLTAFAESLDQLDQLDPRKAQAFSLVEMAGFHVEQAAQLLDVSRATLERDLRFARVWIAARLG